MGAQRLERRHAHDEDRGLRVARLREHLARPFEADLADVEIHELGGAVERFFRGRVGVVKVLAHADVLGTLAREQVRYVHSITNAPQTRPLPNVANTTFSFFFIFPAFTASQSAIAQEAAEVLPYFSRFTNIFSFGSERPSGTASMM